MVSRKAAVRFNVLAITYVHFPMLPASLGTGARLVAARIEARRILDEGIAR